jgi:hypothetical protein
MAESFDLASAKPVFDLQGALAQTDKALGLPPGFSAAQIKVESGFDPQARSPAGAMGLAQVMPDTLKALSARLGRQLDPMDPGDAVQIHREVMRENLARFGSVDKALMAYNGGWDPAKWGNPQTQAYVGKVSAALKGEPSPVMAALGRAASAVLPGAQAAGSSGQGFDLSTAKPVPFDLATARPTPAGPSAAARIAADPITQGAQNFTADMGPLERGAAAAGKAVVDAARGAGQWLGLVDRADVAEARRLDAPLMDTTAGKVGNLAGNIAMLAPTAFIPGAATIPGAAIIGAATGAIEPSTSTGETARNILLGGAAGPAAIGAGRVLAAGYQGGRALLAPFTERGRQGLVNDVLQRSATDPAAAENALRRARPVVAGSEPTVGQAAADPGLAQLERTALANPEMAGPLQQRFAAQRAARRAAVQDVAGQPGHLEAIQEGRRIFANQDYADAIRAGADPAMADALAPQIESLLRRPSILRAQETARNLAAENDQALTNFNSVEGLDWLKKALDNQISAASRPGSAAIGSAELRALEQTRGDLLATLEQIAPAYREANRSYAAMSRQVNSLDVGRQLEGKLYRPGSEYDVPGSAREAGASYQRALSEAVDRVRLANGMERPLGDVLPTRDVAQLEGVAQDLGRKAFAESAGRGVGSPTAQNIVSQNLLRRTLGPTGLPETWGESVALNSLMRPYQWLMRTAEPRVQRLLGETMTDPAAAAAAWIAHTPSAYSSAANGFSRMAARNMRAL